MCTKFYQNQLGFIEDMTKTFVFFSVHSVGKTDKRTGNASMLQKLLT